jgi:hypothetical protein
MSSLFNRKIKETFQGVLHADAAELPESGQTVVYDGLGNKTSVSIGREGNGFKVTSPFHVGNLEYPSNNGGTTTGSIMTQLSGNKLGLKDVSDLFYEFINLLHPVNSILITIDNVNPGSRLARTVWEQVSQGSLIGGVGGNNFLVGDNAGSYTRTISIPEHYHGVGVYTGDNNNDVYLVVARDDARLPATGWIDPNNTYWTRQLNGDGTGRGQDNQVANGATKTRAAITTRAFSYTGGSVTPSVEIDITPPTYGVYVWKRTQ